MSREIRTALRLKLMFPQVRCDLGQKAWALTGRSEASLARVSQRVRYRHLQQDPQPVAPRSWVRRAGHIGSFCRTGLER